MSLSVGIVGLPNVGKSTLFKALTKKAVDISNYPFCTVEPNVGVVEVPDKRLEKLAEISKPEKVVPSIIKFVDVAGLVKGAAKGEGLGNQFLAHLRETDVLLHIVRCFKAENVAHIEGTVNPKRDIETVETEMALKDLETVEKLMTKPQIYLLNCSQSEVPEDLKKEFEGQESDWLQMDLRDELDKTELSDGEREELGLAPGRLDELIEKCYKTLKLLTFFTIVGKEEARAWPVPQGTTVLEGGGKIHSDFKEKFVRAEVINWQRFLEAGNWKRAGQLGLLKTVGRDYILEDGDVVQIKI